MFFNLPLCCSAVWLLLSNVNSQSIRTTVDQGTLEGKLMQTENGVSYRAFLGIPYAKPPIGNLRFRDPVPMGRWQGILNATKEANICAQIDRLFKKTYVGVEDCLYLNVYVPDSIKKNQRLPVMFWVHGGAFISGNGNTEIFGPDHLIQHNVIVVTFNYRVGPLGFLSLNMYEAPGNVGLKDQALALKWVNRNIYRFGGNPREVTVFGESAGGASVNFLMLTPLTRGMYSKVILQSGTSQNEWALQRDYLNNSFKLGALLGTQTKDKRQLVNYLLNVPVQQLVIASFSSTLGPNPLLPTFVPTIEKFVPFTSTFINKDPRVLMNNIRINKIPVMIGFLSQEGYMGFNAMRDQIGQLMTGNGNLSTVIPDFTMFVPSYLKEKYDSQKVQVVAQMIKAFYFPNEENLLNSLLKLLTDDLFINEINSAAKIFSKQTDTYFYDFSFHGSLNLFKTFYPLPYEGAAHSDELGYIFSPNFEELSNNPVPVVTEKETLMIQRMTTMWTNFAKYGNPTPSTTEILTTIWKPINQNTMNCLSIDEQLTMIENPLQERMQFWKSLENL